MRYNSLCVTLPSAVKESALKPLRVKSGESAVNGCICPYLFMSYAVDRFAELEQYSALQFSPANDSAECDVFIDRPTILIKLDAGLSFSMSLSVSLCPFVLCSWMLFVRPFLSFCSSQVNKLD